MNNNIMISILKGIQKDYPLTNAEWQAIEQAKENAKDDAISRQYLLDIATKDGAYGYISAQEIANAPSVKPQGPIREFTEEEAKAYSKALDKMYKPTGFNVLNDPCKEDEWRNGYEMAWEEAKVFYEQEPCDKCEVGNPCLYCKHEFKPRES